MCCIVHGLQSASYPFPSSCRSVCVCETCLFVAIRVLTFRASSITTRNILRPSRVDRPYFLCRDRVACCINIRFPYGIVIDLAKENPVVHSHFSLSLRIFSGFLYYIESIFCHHKNSESSAISRCRMFCLPSPNWDTCSYISL